MLEMLQTGRKNSGPANGRSFRLVGLATPSRPLIGILELEIIDAAGRNLCRTAGYIPTVIASPALKAAYANGEETTYPPSLIIDGFSANNWMLAAYIYQNADGSRYFEITFPQDVNITKWRCMIEASAPPTANGLKLMSLQGGVWKTVVGTPDAPDWNNQNKWREWTNLSFA